MRFLGTSLRTSLRPVLRLVLRLILRLIQVQIQVQIQVLVPGIAPSGTHPACTTPGTPLHRTGYMDRLDHAAGCCTAE